MLIKLDKAIQNIPHAFQKNVLNSQIFRNINR